MMRLLMEMYIGKATYIPFVYVGESFNSSAKNKGKNLTVMPAEIPEITSAIANMYGM